MVQNQKNKRSGSNRSIRVGTGGIAKLSAQQAAASVRNNRTSALQQSRPQHDLYEQAMQKQNNAAKPRLTSASTRERTGSSRATYPDVGHASGPADLYTLALRKQQHGWNKQNTKQLDRRMSPAIAPAQAAAPYHGAVAMHDPASQANTLHAWLQQIDPSLARHASTLAQEEVDVPVLRTLSENDLKQLGLPLGARKKIVSAVKQGR